MMKNKDIKFLAVVCLLMQGICSYAQLSTYESPVSFSKNHLQWHASAVTLPVLDMKAISREDSIDNEKDLPPRFGFPHKVNLNLENAGEWKVLPNGDRLWNLTITCPGAKSINLLYDKYWLPEGAKLFVYSKDRSHTIGAFTSKNNKGTKDMLCGFATELVYSDTIVVEYFEPKASTYQGVVSISHVVQGYRNINDMINGGFGYGCSGNCQVNVNCSEGQNWQKEKNAVAMMILEGYRYGTGFLINSTANNFSPLFMTSNLCINTYDAANHSNMYSCIFYWHYETPSCCNPITAPTYYTTSGATVLANMDFSSGTDFALLSLAEDPKNNPNVPLYYLGWDNSGIPGDSLVCIHHPRGDVKKIATSNPTPSIHDIFWELYWNQTDNGYSVPEAGSVGAPLINGDRHVIGQLYVSYDNDCNNPSQDISSFEKFNKSWTGNGTVDNRRKLQPWLDPLNTGITVQDGIDLTNDLYVRDTMIDNGSEPSEVCYAWESPDIWIEDMFNNVITRPYNNGTYKVCVRVHNRNAYPSRGNEWLLLNWAKAGVNLVWSDNWSGNTYFSCGQPKGGFIDSVQIPSIPAYGDIVVKVEWQIPSLSLYENCSEFGGDKWHFCLLARIHDGHSITHEDEVGFSMQRMTLDHNNVAWKNLYTNQAGDIQTVISVSNGKPVSLLRNIILSSKEISNVGNITDYAEVYITLDNGLLAALGSSNIGNMEWVDGNTLRWTGGSACIPVTLPANSNYTLMTTVHFLADQTPAANSFDFDIVLRSAVGDSILGGEHYRCIRTDGRWFQALASAAADVDAITFSAEELDEDAVYEWFDMNGNFLFEGTEYTLTGAESGCYVLRVTASADGYRAYSTLCVTLPDAMLSSIYPNPADGEVSIGYQLSRRIAGGTIQIVSANGVKMYSQAVTNTTKGKTMKGTLKLSTAAFAPGQYIVRILSSKGEVYDSKTLIVR